MVVNRESVEVIHVRLSGIGAESKPLWGMMNAGQMMRHLRRFVEALLGKVEVKDKSRFLN